MEGSDRRGPAAQTERRKISPPWSHSRLVHLAPPNSVWSMAMAAGSWVPTPSAPFGARALDASPTTSQAQPSTSVRWCEENPGLARGARNEPCLGADSGFGVAGDGDVHAAHAIPGQQIARSVMRDGRTLW